MVKKKKEKPVSFVRPPIVAVVGHIDHGKTTLLDKIRESQLASKEEKGITQHISASQIEFTDSSQVKQKVTFIDTPGHASFSKMRARGVEVTDLVVLVVAADQGVQDQTKESLKHIQQSGTPFLIALNKIDLPTANIDKVKGQLSEIGVVPEDYGGDVVVVPVSAKAGDGIDDLLEMIVLMAELQEFKESPDQVFSGAVIESRLDKKKGTIATVLVKNGTLKTGDVVYAEEIKAKVKMMTDWLGNQKDEALPGDVVEVLGFKQVLPVGASVGVQPQEVDKKRLSENKSGEIKVVVKADTQGSLEAIIESLPEEVEVVKLGVGEITDKDIFVGQTFDAGVYGFQVGLSRVAENMVDQEKVKVFCSKAIYDVLDEIKNDLEDKINPLKGKDIFGKAEVLKEFKIKGKKIAGCRVVKGTIVKNSKILLMRDEEVIARSVVVSLRHDQDDIDEVKKNMEFGAVFSPAIDFVVKDVIISYRDEKDDSGSK